MQIRSGPAVVIAAGEVTSYGGADLDFRLEVDGTPVELTLRFTTDPDVPDVAVTSEARPHGIRLHCVNFDTADGRGTGAPVVVETVGTDAILLHFRVFRFGRTVDRTVHYTFFRVPVSALS